MNSVLKAVLNYDSGDAYNGLSPLTYLLLSSKCKPNWVPPMNVGKGFEHYEELLVDATL